MPALGARDVALEALLRVELDSAYLDRVLPAAFTRTPLSDEDRALATELAFGTLRRRIELDRWIERLTERPLAKLDPPTQMALRIGLLQILFLDRIPPHAAVNETVEALKRRRRSAASLVNAALRRVSDPARRPSAPTPTSAIDALVLAGSLPPWLAERFASIAEAKKVDPMPLAASLTQPAHPTLRVRAGAPIVERLMALGIDATPTQHVATGVCVRRAGAIDKLPGFGRDFIAQDEAAQWAISLVEKEHGPTLDACAAPGGKTIALCDFGHHPLVAMESNTARCKLLRGSLAAATVEAEIIQASAEEPPFPAESFATVVLDAPCTGSGTLRRHPEIKYRMQPTDILRLISIQAKMLRALAPLVRPGGALLYVVCSIFPEEGERQIDTFLREQPFLCEESLSTFANLEVMDGFFAARLRRNGV